MSTPKLAVWKFASCDGCQLTLLDCEDELLPLAAELDIAYFLEAGLDRVEGTYAGTTIERWQAADGRVKLSGTDTSALRFTVMINGRAPDEPVTVTVLDREYPYACTPTTLELGPYRYARA